jgi:hypothetical protein
MNMNVKTVASDSRSFSYQEKMTVKWRVPDAAHGMSRILASAQNHRPDVNLQAPPEGYRGDRVSPIVK